MRYQLRVIVSLALITLVFGDVSGPLSSSKKDKSEEDSDSKSNKVSGDFNDDKSDSIDDIVKRERSFVSRLRDIGNSPTFEETGIVSTRLCVVE